MKVLISGSSGFIGSRLKPFLVKHGYVIDTLSREDLKNPLNKIKNADAIINLAGVPIIKKWTKQYKKEIYQSRIYSTQNIVEAIKKTQKTKFFISTSAVGIYPSSGTHNEFSTEYANNFLAEVCKDWEKEAFEAKNITRTIIFRLGVVLGNTGGAFQKMLKPFKFGLGGKLGNGKQPMSWIHINDLLQVYKFALEQHQMDGIYNLVAPENINNAAFTKLLANHLKKTCVLQGAINCVKSIVWRRKSNLTLWTKSLP